MVQSPKSNLELIQACDRSVSNSCSFRQRLIQWLLTPSFPYDDPFEPQSGVFSSYYKFLLPGDTRPHGLLLPSVVKVMPWTADFIIDHFHRTVQLDPRHSDNRAASACIDALARLIQAAIDKDTFTLLHGQHSELYPIIGAKYPIAIERFARSLFGITARGAHLTAYTITEAGMKIWVPRRSAHLYTYPNCLDTTVAGGVTAGEGPFECIVREAAEEASIPEDIVRTEASSCGVLSYITLRESRGGGEEGLVCPDLIYVYDLKLTPDVIPKPGDDEVSEFYLWDVDEVRQGLARGEFKTNSALVMIDFLIRHGFITTDNETHFAEINARMHRRLPCPTSSAWALYRGVLLSAVMAHGFRVTWSW